MAREASNQIIDEREPLLRQGSPGHVSETKQKRRWVFWATPIVDLNIKHSTLVPVLGMLMVFLNESEFYLRQAATVRAIEAMACHEYYSQLDNPLAGMGKKIPEILCKNPTIQERVAKLYGASYGVRMICAVTGTTCIVSFFSTGARRPILVVHKFNLLCTQALTLIAYLGYPRVPIWLICLNGVSALVGGNFDLAISTVFASYADVVTDPVRRSTLIFVTSSLQYASQAIFLPITSRLINLDGQGTTPEVALWASCACVIIVFLLILLLYPETSQSGKTRSTTPFSRGSNVDVHSSSSSEDFSPASPAPIEVRPSRPFQVLKHDFGLLKMGLLLGSMFCSVTASRLVDWYGLMQYPSIKFQWVLSKTTLLVTSLAIISFLNFSLLLPQFNKLCTQTLSLPPRMSSILLSGTSALVILTACILMGLPTTTVAMFIGGSATYTLGSGINSAIHAYTVNVANDSRASGMALTVLSLGATGGKVIASILWPVLLEWGLEADSGSGKWSGLPFLVAGAVAVISTGAITTAEWVERRSRGKKREFNDVTG